MRFSVRHETLYRYSAPVRLASHVLRLNPRVDGAALVARSLTIDPTPTVRQELTDRFGNSITHVDFEGLSDCLRIESRFDLDTVAAAPPIDQGLPPLPWPSALGDGMAEYRSGDEQDVVVRGFASELASESGWAVLTFLDRLNRTLFTRVKHDIRIEGAARTPAHTLATGRGACRDVTVLFMAACHSLGIAARFVSGYQAHADTPDGRRHLHAWPEVFLPALAGAATTRRMALPSQTVMSRSAQPRTRRRQCLSKAASTGAASPARSNTTCRFRTATPGRRYFGSADYRAKWLTHRD